MCVYFGTIFVYSILTHDGSVHGLERDRVFLYDDSTHVLSFDQLRKVSMYCSKYSACKMSFCNNSYKYCTTKSVVTFSHWMTKSIELPWLQSITICLI